MNEVTENEQLSNELAPVVAKASEIRITEPQHYTEAADFLKAIKGAQKRVVDHFSGMKSAAHAAWKRITATEAETLRPLERAESEVKSKMLAYSQEQERSRLAEQRRLQAEADERARQERARLEKEAAKLKTPELKEERLEQAAAVVAPIVTVASVKPVVAGIAVKKVWKARLTSIHALTGFHGGDVRLSFLEFNQAAANRFAAATKGSMSVAGVEFYEEQSLSSASR